VPSLHKAFKQMNWLPGFEESLILVFFYVFASIAGFQLIYVIYFYSRLAFYRKKENSISSHLPSVSVIIAARNESENLYNNLPLILEQNFPNFEVIVINHQSIDESYHILNAYKMQYPHLKIIEVERSKHLGVGKKLPLTLGIKAAKNEHLVFTDADCIPASKDWLRIMASRFSEKKKIIIGYGPYKVEKGFLNKIIRLDTAMIAMNYFSFALARLPYMGVGRNLAYTKETFKTVSGFKSHYSISSGDDDLFIQEAAKKKNYCIELDEHSHCYSDAKKTWKTWTLQKSRHYTTSGKYQFIKKALLGIYPLTLILMWISFVTLMFNFEYRWLTLMVFVFVLLVKWLIQGMCLFKLKARGFVALFPFLDLFYAILIPAIYYTSEKSSQTKWK
jgi:poly-beta-1,6-N-acetyl-D-glucosamine synthase